MKIILFQPSKASSTKLILCGSIRPLKINYIRMKRIIVLLILSLSAGALQADHFASWTKTELTLNNGIVKRVINLPSANSGFITTLYSPLTGNFNYFVKSNPDFQFEVNDIIYSGKGNWKLLDIHIITDSKEGDGAAVKLFSEDKKIELTINYLLLSLIHISEPTRL